MLVACRLLLIEYDKRKAAPRDCDKRTDNIRMCIKSNFSLFHFLERK